MSQLPEDPVVQGGRREAAVVLVVFLAAMSWTVGYCYLYGYDVPAEEITFVYGVPSWAFWGILAPWLACLLVSFWFGRLFMGTPSLGQSVDDPEDDDDV
jgi:hypothetical protein